LWDRRTKPTLDACGSVLDECYSRSCGHAPGVSGARISITRSLPLRPSRHIFAGVAAINLPWLGSQTPSAFSAKIPPGLARQPRRAAGAAEPFGRLLHDRNQPPGELSAPASPEIFYPFYAARRMLVMPPCADRSGGPAPSSPHSAPANRAYAVGPAPGREGTRGGSLAAWQ